MPAFENTDPPRDIRIEEEKHTYFDEFSGDERSPFYEADYKDIFVFAAAYGFHIGSRTPLEGETRALVNRPSLTDSQEWIVKSIAIKEVEDGRIVKDGSEMFDIIHAYGNGGLEDLYKMYKRPGNMYKELSNQVIETYQNLG